MKNLFATPPRTSSRSEIDQAAPTSRERVMDVLFLLLLAALPAVFYVSTLGFYLDDYYELQLMSTSHDQSLWGLYSALLSGDPKSHLRPIEYFLLAVLYWLFGTNPLPYHIFLAALVPLCAAVLYVVLRQLRQPRYLALGVPIIFAAAPHYSTDRLWTVASSPTITLTLYLISLYCVLRALESRSRRLVGWVTGGVATMLSSAFVYEITLPLFVLTAVFFWYRARRCGSRGTALAATSYASWLALAIAVKVVLSLQVGKETSYSIAGYQGGLPHHIAYIISGAIKVNFGTYGIGLPYVLWWILDHRFSLIVLGASVLVWAVTFLYLTRGVSDLELSSPARTGQRWPVWRELIAAGLLLLVLGYALFVVTGEIYFTSVGIDNRVNIIPALGVSVLAVGLLLRVTAFVRAEWRRSAFSLGIAAVVMAGVLVTNTIADFWGSAYSRQKEVLERLEQALPRDPSGTTLLLDGMCPEVGPGIIFLGDYDLAGAIRTHYRDTTIGAAMMTDDVDPDRMGLVIGTTWLGVTQRRLYSYQTRLLVYDWRRASVTHLKDADAARAYLMRTPRISCPPRRSFTWGIHTSRWMPLAEDRVRERLVALPGRPG